MVEATPPGYTVQSYPYAENVNYDNDLRSGGFVVIPPYRKLAPIKTSNYYAVVENFFTNPFLLRKLKSKGITNTGTVTTCQPETQDAFIINFPKLKVDMK